MSLGNLSLQSQEWSRRTPLRSEELRVSRSAYCSSHGDLFVSSDREQYLCFKTRGYQCLLAETGMVPLIGCSALREHPTRACRLDTASDMMTTPDRQA